MLQYPKRFLGALTNGKLIGISVECQVGFQIKLTFPSVHFSLNKYTIIFDVLNTPYVYICIILVGIFLDCCPHLYC